MILRLVKSVTDEQIRFLEDRIVSLGLRADVSRGIERTLIGLVGDTSPIDPGLFTELEWVEEVIRVSRPYKRVSREQRPEGLTIRVGSITFGGPEVVIMAGPCSVEDRPSLLSLARRIQKAGAHALRGGAYKPRKSPYSFQGLGREGLLFLAEASRETGLPIISEATGLHHHRTPAGALEEATPVDAVIEMADILQVGMRNMKSYGLLEEIARRTGPLKMPVLLKRGESATLEEFLLAAEYLALHGNPLTLLCVRGIRTFENQQYQRYTSDIAAIPILKRESHLPVIFDPSHATGDHSLISPLSLAAVAAGADGLLIETHESPRQAISDGRQSITPDELTDLIVEVRRLSGVRTGRDQIPAL
ncbi:MAG: 3-deoxy-7-phosphoheptulonate synthase [Candidatus Eisenbacteria bacterium]|nr:3-deoxy-7-phosphoheptulonate synthase [Candidatus Eisenbacteria bacterium]